MRNIWDREECVCVIGSVTQTMRAQKLLSAKGIRTDLIKADAEQTGDGCAYALSYSCMQNDTVRVILQNAGIAPRGFYGGGR